MAIIENNNIGILIFRDPFSWLIGIWNRYAIH
jgi:hypothetical protein